MRSCSRPGHAVVVVECVAVPDSAIRVRRPHQRIVGRRLRIVAAFAAGAAATAAVRSAVVAVGHEQVRPERGQRGSLCGLDAAALRDADVLRQPVVAVEHVVPDVVAAAAATLTICVQARIVNRHACKHVGGMPNFDLT